MQCYGRANSGEQVHLTSIAELLLGCSGRGWLNELSETSSSIRESPGRQLDAERLERMKDLLSSA
jgi:hypothetical protein